MTRLIVLAALLQACSSASLVEGGLPPETDSGAGAGGAAAAGGSDGDAGAVVQPVGQGGAPEDAAAPSGGSSGEPTGKAGSGGRPSAGGAPEGSGGAGGRTPGAGGSEAGGARAAGGSGAGGALGAGGSEAGGTQGAGGAPVVPDCGEFVDIVPVSSDASCRSSVASATTCPPSKSVLATFTLEQGTCARFTSSLFRSVTCETSACLVAVRGGAQRPVSVDAIGDATGSLIRYETEPLLLDGSCPLSCP